MVSHQNEYILVLMLLMLMLLVVLVMLLMLLILMLMVEGKRERVKHNLQRVQRRL